ncbi:MAG: xanthine dehydrogenase family protein molybdopterin-binding subunit [Gammaproteobacteria bacterium]|nr:xanthine dehydrogenase family protein molybdopterin-binding subunit [Gammaproteobacteria bacterium]
MADNGGLKYIGTRPVRPDGVDKVTGRAEFGADWAMPGMVSGKVVRSPHAHARIRSIDTSEAEALPGVLAVITAADFPDRSGFRPARRAFNENLMASGKVLFHGHPVAAVAAVSGRIAEQAADLVEVDYEVLEPVTDILEAMQPEAPVLHEDMFTEGLEETPTAPSNVSKKAVISKGDALARFADADVVVERTFVTPMVHQGYIEPHACVGSYGEDGTATVWCCTQGHFSVRELTGMVLGMDPGDIRVIPSEIGGGFGGKTTVYLEPLAVKLSEKCGRPVKMVMSREEVFRATGPASGTVNTVKIGCRTDGRIVAMYAKLIYESGAYSGSPLGAGSMCIFAPYDVDDILIEGYEVVVNRPRVAAYRAPGAPQSMFAGESVIDELAMRIGMDPIDFRMKNAVAEGTRAAYGPVFGAIGLRECLAAAKRHPSYARPLGEDESRGVAVGFWFNGGNQSSAEVHVTDRGTVQVVEGNPDIGGSRAAMALMAAETLGVPYDRIRVRVADTESTGYCAATGGSRTTFATGMAVIQACENVIAELKTRAAATWDLGTDQVEWADGQARPVEGVNLDVEPLSLKDLARSAARTGGPISGRASLTAQGPGPSFSVNMADIHLDRETGRATVVGFTAIQDAGKAVHPDYVEGQMQGGAAQGIGWALNEEYIYDEAGVLDNPGFLDYRVPVASDLPMIETEIVEVPNASHPYGVRGVGETPIVAPLAAVGNAVSRALGVRMTELPLSPPRVLEAIDRRTSKSASAGAGT